MSKIINILFSILRSSLKIHNWKKPKKKSILIYDKYRTEIIEKYFKKKDLGIIDVRYKNNDSINFYIILKLILKLKMSTRSYRNELINQISPKFIISMIDNNYGFYALKNTFPKIKTILIQFAWRQEFENIVPKKFRNTKNKILNRLDYFIVFNEAVKQQFKKFIKANFLIFGSFTSNSFNINSKNLRYKFLLIGQRTDVPLSKYRPSTRSTLEEYLEPDFKFFQKISQFIINEKKDKINILGKSENDVVNATKFYNKLLGKGAYNYINRSGYSYKILDKSEFIIGTTSTLLYEALSRGKKTAIFSHKSKIKKFEHTKYAWPSKIKSKGDFWSDSIEIDEIRRVINFIMKVPETKWKKILRIEFDQILKYDKNNKKFINFANKINMPIIQK